MTVFYILVALALILIWFLAAGSFKAIGKFVYKIGKDAKDIIEEEDKDE